MADSITPLSELDKYIKRLNWYLQEHYPANKKITSEEWNALFLALMKQGNLQEETLEKICNNYLPLQIEKINILVNTANDHESRIVKLRTDTDTALRDSSYAIDTSEEALRRVIQNIGTASYVNGLLMHELFYTADPQAQFDAITKSLDDFEKDFGKTTTEITDSIEEEATTRLANDNALQASIDAERAARIAAISGEASTRATDISNLQTALNTEVTTRTNEVANLQSQIDIMEQNTNVADVVGTFAALSAYDKSKITENDIIEVLRDETRENADTYYRLQSGSWVYVGSLGSYYTKGESDTLLNNKVNYTDYATANKAGLSKLVSTYGIQAIDSAGTAGILKATEAELIAKTNNYKPVVPSNLDIAVREGLGNSSLNWSETYKENARKQLGVNSLTVVTYRRWN